VRGECGTDLAQRKAMRHERLRPHGAGLEQAERLRSEKQLRRKIQNVEALRDLFLSNREKP